MLDSMSFAEAVGYYQFQDAVALSMCTLSMCTLCIIDVRNRHVPRFADRVQYPTVLIGVGFAGPM